MAKDLERKITLLLKKVVVKPVHMEAPPGGSDRVVTRGALTTVTRRYAEKVRKEVAALSSFGGAC